VLICPQGIYAIETKTWNKPWSTAKIANRDGKLLKAGFTPDRDPVAQAAASARWLQDILENKTGRRYEVRGVVAVPGWSVERALEHGSVCVIDPKNLPNHIQKQPTVLSSEEVRALAFDLSRYIRGTSEITAI
jgi:hypothetical protein